MLSNTQIGTLKRMFKKREAEWAKADGIRDEYQPSQQQLRFLVRYDKTEEKIDTMLDSASADQVESLSSWASALDLMSLVMNLDEMLDEMV